MGIGAWSVRLAASPGSRALINAVTAVVGRAYGQPGRMKPDPWALEQASAAVSVPLAEAVLIGDSATDVQAAHVVGARCVGYANQPEKVTASPTREPMRSSRPCRRSLTGRYSS